MGKEEENRFVGTELPFGLVLPEVIKTVKWYQSLAGGAKFIGDSEKLGLKQKDPRILREETDYLDLLKKSCLEALNSGGQQQRFVVYSEEGGVNIFVRLPGKTERLPSDSQIPEIQLGVCLRDTEIAFRLVDSWLEDKGKGDKPVYKMGSGIVCLTELPGFSSKLLIINDDPSKSVEGKPVTKRGDNLDLLKLAKAIRSLGKQTKIVEAGIEIQPPSDLISFIQRSVLPAVEKIKNRLSFGVEGDSRTRVLYSQEVEVILADQVGKIGDNLERLVNAGSLVKKNPYVEFTDYGKDQQLTVTLGIEIGGVLFKITQQVGTDKTDYLSLEADWKAKDVNNFYEKLKKILLSERLTSLAIMGSKNDFSDWGDWRIRSRIKFYHRWGAWAKVKPWVHMNNRQSHQNNNVQPPDYWAEFPAKDFLNAVDALIEEIVF